MFTVSCPNCGATYQLDEAKVGPNGRKLKCAKCAHVWVAHKEPGSQEPGSQEAAAQPVGQPAVAEASEAASAAKVVASEAGTAGAAGAGVDSAAAAPEVEAPSVDEHAPAAMPQADFKVMPVEHLAEVGRLGGLRWFMGVQKWLVLGAVVAGMGISAGLWVLLRGEVSGTRGTEVDMDAPVVARADVAAHEPVAPPSGLVVRDVEAAFSSGEKDAVVFEVKGLLENTSKTVVTIPAFQVKIINKAGEVADVWPVKLDKARLSAGEKLGWEVSFTNPPADDMAGWKAEFVK